MVGTTCPHQKCHNKNDGPVSISANQRAAPVAAVFLRGVRFGPYCIPSVAPLETHPAGEAEGTDGSDGQLEGGVVSDLEIASHLDRSSGGLGAAERRGLGHADGSRGEGRSRSQHGGEENQGRLHLLTGTRDTYGVTHAQPVQSAMHNPCTKASPRWHHKSFLVSAQCCSGADGLY
jgi:hypothetical protein